MRQDLAELVTYRIEKSVDTLKDAKLYFNSATLSSTVNRIYYAVFYAVNALVLSRGLASAKHSGVRALFNREFVKEGLFDKDLGRFFSDMYDNRQEGDYKDFVEFDRNEVSTWLGKAEIFIARIQELINHQ
jgi:uncharacterized protein (UPF0332 family)